MQVYQAKSEYKESAPLQLIRIYMYLNSIWGIVGLFYFFILEFTPVDILPDIIQGKRAEFTIRFILWFTGGLFSFLGAVGLKKGKQWGRFLSIIAVVLLVLVTPLRLGEGWYSYIALDIIVAAYLIFGKEFKLFSQRS